MPSTVFDSAIFRDAFGTPAMRAIFADEATVARYPAGARATAWVNPRNPRTAVLERDAEANRGAWVAAAIVGAIFTVLGLAVQVLVR